MWMGTIVCVTERVLKLPNLILSLQAPGYKAKYSHSDKPHLTHGPQYVLRRLENVTEGWKFAKIKGRIKKTQNKEWDQILVQIWNCKSKSKQPKIACSFQRYTIFSSPSVSLFSVSMVTKGWLTSRTSAWWSPAPVTPADQDSWRWPSWSTSVKTRSDVTIHHCHQ